jgi:hypothetical protein
MGRKTPRRMSGGAGVEGEGGVDGDVGVESEDDDEKDDDEDEAGRGIHLPAVPRSSASMPAFTAAAHHEPMMAYSLGCSFSCFASRRSTVRPQGFSPSTVYTTAPINRASITPSSTSPEVPKRPRKRCQGWRWRWWERTVMLGQSWKGVRRIDEKWRRGRADARRWSFDASADVPIMRFPCLTQPHSPCGA